MTKGMSIGVFGLMILAQWWVPISMVKQYETVLDEGMEIKLQTRPVDPYDLFRGRYVYLTFLEESAEVDTALNWEGVQDVYIQFEEGEGGFSQIKAITQTPPLDTDFLRAEVSYLSGTELFVTYPFTTYYMEESKAPVAEQRFNEASRDTTKQTHAEVRILDGNGLLVDVYIDGISLRKLAEE